MQQRFEYIRTTYKNGYYIYDFVLNFKPDSPYDILHPKKGHLKFKEDVTRYFKRYKTVSYIMFPELSEIGKYHIHGLLIDKETDYDQHIKRMKIICNYIHRKYGWLGKRRIYSMYGEYTTYDIRYKKWCKNSFERVWEYITKDNDKFKFWSYIDTL